MFRGFPEGASRVHHRPAAFVCGRLSFDRYRRRDDRAPDGRLDVEPAAHLLQALAHAGEPNPGARTAPCPDETAANADEMRDAAAGVLDGQNDRRPARKTLLRDPDARRRAAGMARDV